MKPTKVAPNGHKVVLELRRRGEVLGELGAIDGRSRSAAAVALGDVEVVSIAAAAFRELLDTHARIATAVLTTVVGRLRESSGRQLELGTTDALGRVCRRLVEPARSHGELSDEGVVLRGPL